MFDVLLMPLGIARQGHVVLERRHISPGERDWISIREERADLGQEAAPESRIRRLGADNLIGQMNEH